MRKEDNTLPKAGAIGIGGLTGLIFGLRGGFIKRTLYMTSGVLGMAAVCYPKEAAEYSQIGLAESKKYLTIAYNFAYGGKMNIFLYFLHFYFLTKCKCNLIVLNFSKKRWSTIGITIFANTSKKFLWCMGFS